MGKLSQLIILKLLLIPGISITAILQFSCKKADEDLNSTLNKTLKISLVSGNNQSGEFNTTLKDSLVVKVTDRQNRPVSHAAVHFKTINGIGSVSSAFVWTNSSGFAFAKVQLACRLSEHKVIAYLCDEKSYYIDSVSFLATSVKPVKWARACGINYAVEKIRELNNKYYAVSDNMLYISVDGGLNWDLFPNAPGNDIFDVQFNSKGWMYILTRYHGVYYSVNNGSTWLSMSNELFTSGYPLTLMVEDTVIYVSYQGNGLFRTRNNGQSWKKLVVNGTYSEENKFITRHPSGKLYIFDRWDDLFMSVDNGDSWSHINLSYKYLVYEASAFKIGLNGLLYIGSGDATIAVVSPDTYTGEIHRYYKYNSSSQAVNNIFEKENTFYFTLTGSPIPGIYSSNGWKRIDNGFYRDIRSIYLKTNGKFLVGNYDYPNGLYYEPE
jgi:hypothetical protein